MSDAIARAICREQCAFFGEPPCHETGPWPNKECDEPGCYALALAASPEVRKLIEAEQEACAAIADEYHIAALEWAKGVRGLEKLVTETDSSRIADAIRKRKETT